MLTSSLFHVVSLAKFCLALFYLGRFCLVLFYWYIDGKVYFGIIYIGWILQAFWEYFVWFCSVSKGLAFFFGIV